MEAAAKGGKETMEAGVRRTKAAGNADDIMETALAAAAVALLVSLLKTLLDCALGTQRPGLLMGPSPLLFLLLQLVIASIVFVSTHSAANTKPEVEGRKKAATSGAVARREAAGTASCPTTHSQGKRQQQARQNRSSRRRRQRLENEDGAEDKRVDGEVEGGGGATDELNARAEAFISAFRQHLKLDSISSHNNSGCGRRASRAASFRY